MSVHDPARLSQIAKRIHDELNGSGPTAHGVVLIVFDFAPVGREPGAGTVSMIINDGDPRQIAQVLRNGATRLAGDQAGVMVSGQCVIDA